VNSIQKTPIFAAYFKPQMPANNTHICPLCHEKASFLCAYRSSHYFECHSCKGIFLGKQFLPNVDEEKNRYQEHNNDVEDTGYQKFVSPIVHAVLNDYTENHKGLDFGAGTGPVISKLLHDKQYRIVQYDPFFHNYPDLLEGTYDYIVCCEVIEHFHSPHNMFSLLKKLLNPNGKLYCMTQIYKPEIVFSEWYYKNDPTHVFFYNVNTFAYIRSAYNFKDLQIENNMITLCN